MAQDDWRRLLDRYLYDIAVALQPVIDDISMKLKPNLAACEYAEIDSIPNKMKKVEMLVNSVRSRDLATFNKFCEIVEGCGHKKLAQKLQGVELYIQVIHTCAWYIHVYSKFSVIPPLCTFSFSN